MKITEHTATILKLQMQSRLRVNLMLVLFGSLFWLAGLVVILSGRSVTFNCNRIEAAQMTCERTSSGVFGKESHLNLKVAESWQTTDSAGDTTYGVLLISEHHEISQTSTYRSENSAQQNSLAAQINAFVDDPDRTSLEVKTRDRRPNYLFGSVWILLGGGVSYFYAFYQPLISCCFDKNSGLVSLKRRNILFRSSIFQERLDNLEKAYVDQTIDSDSDKNNPETKLMLKSGQSISLGELGNDFDNVEVINHFLGIS